MAKTEKSASRWQVEDAGPEHLAQIQALFKTAFKTDMSAEQWHWKYDDGRGFGMIVRQANEVVAYFGGMEHRVLFKGNPVLSYHRHLVSNAIGQDLIGLLVTRQIEDRLILVDVVSTKRPVGPPCIRRQARPSHIRRRLHLRGRAAAFAVAMASTFVALCLHRRCALSG